MCGPVSGIIVLDVDGQRGYELLKDRKLPKTWSVRTPSGGIHYYFKWVPALNERVTTKTDIIPGEKGDLTGALDVRGEGGFVVYYGFQVSPFLVALASPPEWLIQALPKKAVGGDRPRVAQVVSGIKEGNRNDSFARIAGSLRAKGYGEEEIYALLEPKARETGLDDAELRAVVRSICRYEPAWKDKASENQDMEAFLDTAERVEWICSGLVPKKGIGFVAGLPETSKTWLLMDLAVEAARAGGGMWLGKFEVSESRVLFIDQERFRGETQRRFRALLAAKSLKASDVKGNLSVQCGSTIRLDDAASFEHFRRLLLEFRPGIVIVDSFATFHGTDENNRTEIQKVLEKVKQLRAEFGCTILFIDHETKGVFQAQKEGEPPNAFGMAGSVAKPAAAEVVLTVRKTGENTMVYHTKSSLAPAISPFSIRVRDLDAEGSKIVVEAN